MTGSSALRYWLLAFALCVAAVIFSVAYVDRPVADYVHANLLQLVFFEVIGDALAPLAAVVVLALLLLLGSACWVATGRPLGSWTGTPLLCSWSLVWALAAEVTLKRIFGRAEPEYWTGASESAGHLGVYGFRLLRGHAGFESFPSGTMAIAASILSVLWILVPRLRVIWALVFAFVAVAIVVTNGHFVADVIAGAFLGASIGWMTVRLLGARS